MLISAARAGPVRLALLIAALALGSAAPIGQATAQPDPVANAKQLRVDSADVNVSATPSFTFAVTIPTVLHFQAFDYGNQHILRIYAISRVDSLTARIRQTSAYLDTRPGIFAPLFETPRGTPIMGYVDREEFSRAVQRALRDIRPERTLIAAGRLRRS